jgi:DNA-binding FadR family transcriptional regulator
MKTAETFARDLVRDISARGLRPGDKLPSEAVMLAEFGLSRESLREGLRLLEVQDLISIRRGPGGGPVVGRPNPASLGRTATLYYHLAGATYDELLEAWMITESILVERASRNPDRHAVRTAMEPYLSWVEEQDDTDAPRFHHSDFHRAVAALARNRVLEMMLQTPCQIVAHHVLGLDEARHDAASVGSDHVAIAEAVVAGSPQKAAKAMQYHIERVSLVHRDLLDGHDVISWR